MNNASISVYIEVFKNTFREIRGLESGPDYNRVWLNLFFMTRRQQVEEMIADAIQTDYVDMVGGVKADVYLHAAIFMKLDLAFRNFLKSMARFADVIADDSIDVRELYKKPLDGPKPG